MGRTAHDSGAASIKINVMRQSVSAVEVCFSRRNLVLLVTLVLGGCTPPYPIQKRTTGPSGPIKNLPAPSIIQLGTTTRDEVVQEFKQVDSGVSSPWFFWGRWATSSFALSAVTDSGVEQIPISSATNLLVEFDASGKAKGRETLSDKRIVPALQQIIADHVQATHPLNESLNIEADFYPSLNHASCYGSIKMSSGVVELSSPKPEHMCGAKYKPAFALPVRKLTVASFTPPPGEFGPWLNGWIRVTLQFTDKTPVGTSLPASLKLDDLVSLLNTLEAARTVQSRHGAL
jgi:hypothetical protein